ncbi:hypothetical protein C8Q73DRAFT_638274 [Cubamyces lactineus]|nr:hypothetical protein C8Q73DRAFT_638274 [Cubamyces lactineus]
MRQRGMSVEDQRFRLALTNLRYKACTDDDRALLRSRVISFDAHSTCSLPVLTNISVITARNSHRDAINELGVEAFARLHGRELVSFYSIDRWCSDKGTGSVRQNQRDYEQSINPVRTNNSITDGMRNMLWCLPPCLTDHHAGILRLCRGMPVILKVNEATELCATNGAEALVYDWHSTSSEDGKQVLETLFVKLVNPPKSVTLPGLPDNVIPLNRAKVRIKCIVPTWEKPLYIDREQVTVLPNFAMTDFASQGRTRSINVCHLKYCRSSQSLYTCLSRSSSLSNTYIIDGFDDSKMVGGLHAPLKREFRELEILDDISTLAYDGRLPNTISLSYRSEAIRTYIAWKGERYVPPLVHPALDWSHEGLSANTARLPTIGVNLPVKHPSNARSGKPRTNKRKRKAYDVIESTNVTPGDKSAPSQFKKRRVEGCLTSRSSSVNTSLLGFIWDSHNYSCAYDALFTIILNAYIDGPIVQMANDPLMNEIYHALMRAMNDIALNGVDLEVRRDSIRDYLYHQAPNLFPRHGLVLTAVSDIVEYIFRPSQSFGRVVNTCSVCDVVIEVSRSLNSPLWVLTRRTDESSGSGSQAVIEDILARVLVSDGQTTCPHCGTGTNRYVDFDHAPPFLFVELQPTFSSQMVTCGRLVWPVRGVHRQWRLCGVIFLGANHFVCRYIDISGRVWYHDGMSNGRWCTRETNDNTSMNVFSANNRRASHLVYVLC